MSYSAPITTGPPTTGPVLVGPETSKVVCPFCSANVLTTVLYTENSGTYIAGALWGRLCCLCCIPFCSDSAKNADHYCPNCQKYLGTYQRM